MKKLKKLWGTDKKDYSPEFTACGLGLDKIQFSYRNVTGRGATTRRGAVANWFKQVIIEWRK